MPRAKAPVDEPQLDKCFNHPDAPAAASVDGGGAHSPIAYCAACLHWYRSTRPAIRRD